MSDRGIVQFRLRETDFGSQQMNEVYDFIDFRDQVHATIEKIYRILLAPAL